MNRLTWTSLLAITATAVVACGGDDEEPNTAANAGQQCPYGQYWNGQYCVAQGQVQPGPTAQPTAAPTAQPTATAPPAGTGAPPAGGTAQPLDPTAAQAATVLLAPMAQQHAPGAKAVGQVMAGNFGQGASMEIQVQMQPGKCYTVIGAGVPTITNLDIKLVPGVSMPGLPMATVAEDKTTGPQAVLAPHPDCYKWALPMAGPMKVIVTASAGQGMAAAQVYEK